MKEPPSTTPTSNTVKIEIKGDGTDQTTIIHNGHHSTSDPNVVKVNVMDSVCLINNDDDGTFPNGLDNPAYDNDGDTASSSGGRSVGYSGTQDETDREDTHSDHTNANDKLRDDDCDKSTEEIAEAVNLELMNMSSQVNGAATNGTAINGFNGLNGFKEVDGLPVKDPNATVINMSNSYEEYFIPVNEHRKYMRGEKLIVTKSKRDIEKSKSKCCVWMVGLVTVMIGICLALLIVTKLGQDSNASERQFPDNLGTAQFFPKGTNVGQESTRKYLEHAVEGEFTIQNITFTHELADHYSKHFKELASSVENELKNILFNATDFDNEDIYIRVINLTPEKVITYRIGWIFKTNSSNNADPLTTDTLKEQLKGNLIEHNDTLANFKVPSSKLYSKLMIDDCALNNGNCSHSCSFDYKVMLDFYCHCPEGMKIDRTQYNCENITLTPLDDVNVDEINTTVVPETPTEPEPPVSSIHPEPEHEFQNLPPTTTQSAPESLSSDEGHLHSMPSSSIQPEYSTHVDSVQSESVGSSTSWATASAESITSSYSQQPITEPSVNTEQPSAETSTPSSTQLFTESSSTSENSQPPIITTPFASVGESASESVSQSPSSQSETSSTSTEGFQSDSGIGSVLPQTELPGESAAEHSEVEQMNHSNSSESSSLPTVSTAEVNSASEQQQETSSASPMPATSDSETTPQTIVPSPSIENTETTSQTSTQTMLSLPDDSSSQMEPSSTQSSITESEQPTPPVTSSSQDSVPTNSYVPAAESPSTPISESSSQLLDNSNITSGTITTEMPVSSNHYTATSPSEVIENSTLSEVSNSTFGELLNDAPEISSPTTLVEKEANSPSDNTAPSTTTAAVKSDETIRNGKSLSLDEINSQNGNSSEENLINGLETIAPENPMDDIPVVTTASMSTGTVEETNEINNDEPIEMTTIFATSLLEKSNDTNNNPADDVATVTTASVTYHDGNTSVSEESNNKVVDNSQTTTTTSTTTSSIENTNTSYTGVGNGLVNENTTNSTDGSTNTTTVSVTEADGSPTSNAVSVTESQTAATLIPQTSASLPSSHSNADTTTTVSLSPPPVTDATLSRTSETTPSSKDSSVNDYEHEDESTTQQGIGLLDLVGVLQDDQRLNHS